MQTQFSLAQLADPDIAEADKILRNCVHCGFCTATCPTYVLLGDELDSPRGRIYLIKEMLEQGRAAGETEARHIDRCLSCLSCMTTCPSGVHYMHLVDHARHHIAETYDRPLKDRWLRRLLAAVIPNPDLFRWSLRFARLVNVTGVARVLPGQMRAMLQLAPSKLPSAATTDKPGYFPAQGARRARVALLPGCAQSVLRPEINAAAIRLLNRLGVEVVIAEELGCCGALTHHMGFSDTARRAAIRNIEAWTREAERADLDAIVMTASGCGTTVKDYGFMFRNDPAWSRKAQQVSSLTCDISEFIARVDSLPRNANVAGIRVAYHSACSLQHGQGVTAPPKQILTVVGFNVVDVPEGHLCCGSAGTYNMLQPELSQQLRDRKAGNINALKCQVVATGNIGCIQQLAPVLAAPIVHTVELLDWATGGEKPEALT